MKMYNYIQYLISKNISDIHMIVQYQGDKTIYIINNMLKLTIQSNFRLQ